MTGVANISASETRAASGPLLRNFALTDSENDPMASVTTRYGEPARPLSENQADVIEGLFQSGLVEALVQAGWLAPSRLDAFDGATWLVQPDLLPASHPGELPPAMRRDAARAVLQVSRSLDRHGYVLATADMSGVFVSRTGRPMFHDLTAVRRKEDAGFFPYRSFHTGHLAPIRLLAGQPAAATLVQRAGTIDIPEDLALRHPTVMRISRLLGSKFAAAFHRFAIMSPFAGLLHNGLPMTFAKEALAEARRRRRGEVAPPQWNARLIDRLIRRIDNAKPTATAQHWTNYHAGNDLTAVAHAEHDDWRRHYDDPRARALIDHLSDGAGRTLLDIGANQGYYAMLAAHCGFAVTAVDFDIGAVDALYGTIRKSDHRLAVRPLVVDFVALQKADYPRLSADTVIALGFSHHMRLVELLPWAVIVDKLAGLTHDTLITEFKPGTKATAANPRIAVDDYTLDSFVSALRTRFATVVVDSSNTAPGSSSPRDMIICRK